MFRDKISEIDGRLALLQEAEDNYYVTASYLLELSQKAYEIFKRSEVEEKRQIIKLALQNLTLVGKQLKFEPVSPFKELVSATNRQSWWAMQDSNLRHTD